MGEIFVAFWSGGICAELTMGVMLFELELRHMISRLGLLCRHVERLKAVYDLHSWC